MSRGSGNGTKAAGTGQSRSSSRPRAKSSTRSRPTQFPHRTAAAVAAVAIISLGLLVYGLTRPSQAPTVTSPLDAELESLRAQNGLYFHPVLLNQVFPSIETSAYDFSVLKLAGRPPASPWSDAEATRLGRQAIDANPVWGPWYLYLIDRATGTRFPGDIATSVLGSYKPAGYFGERTMNPGDAVSQIAATEAALEVIISNNISLSSEQRSTLVAWLGAHAVGFPNPYVACNMSRSLSMLGLPQPATLSAYVNGWWNAIGSRRGQPNTLQDVLDLSGFACLLRASGRSNDARAAVVKSQVLPALSQPGDAFVDFYLATAWADLSGDPSALTVLASTAAVDLTASGLAAGPVVRLGTIESTYYVTEIRRLAGLTHPDALLATELRNADTDPAGLHTPLSELMAARVLFDIGQPDVEIKAAAVNDARLDVSARVTQAHAATWGDEERLLAQLGVQARPAPVVPWDSRGAEGRLTAWIVLGHPLDVANPDGLFATELAAIPATLSQPGSSLTMKELNAGVAALQAHGQTDQVPVAAVRVALEGMRGCAGLPDLYRAAAGATDCDLAATYEAFWLNSMLPKEGV